MHIRKVSDSFKKKKKQYDFVLETSCYPLDIRMTFTMWIISFGVDSMTSAYIPDQPS